MAQVIRPEVWQEGIDDNRLLPGRYTTGLFTGSGVKIANNNEACRVWDIQVTDYITDYDDRRINGLLGNKWGPFTDSQSATKYNGNDGWSASAYGVFQDVRFDSRVYTMGRHRSIAMRLFDEMQYAGDINYWGDASTSSVQTNGQALMKTAQLLSRAKDIWQKQVLGPDIDKYNLFAILNGHISGRWVQTNPDQVMDPDASQGTWVAQPGMVQGEAIPPRFAPIHCIEFDTDNIPLLLQTIKVTWNDLFIPQENRVILIDPHYEYDFMAALTGRGIPVTEAAYSDIQNGSFTRLMGWDISFEIPSAYWPKLYVDGNLNVVHSANGQAAYDQLLVSTNHSNAGRRQLELELADSDRMNRPNFVRTVWDPTAGEFTKVVTNYPLGMPAMVDYFGTALPGNYDKYGVTYTQGVADQNYPWTVPGAGYGLDADATGSVLDAYQQNFDENYDATATPKSNWAFGPAAPISLQRVIGLALYKPAAQLSQEYSEMRTAEGETRGKFTEMVMDVKYDAWVIESLSHGILPILDTVENEYAFALPVEIVGGPGSSATAPLNVTGTVTTSGTATVTPADGATWKTEAATVTP